LRLLQRAAEWSPSRWLLALGIPFGLAFALVTPPLQAPDEMPHLARALAISEGTLGAEKFVDGKPSIRVPQSFVALPGRLGTGLQMHAERRQDPALVARELARPQRLSPRSWRPLPSVYSPIVYLPQAVGVAVARMLGLPVLWFVYAARLQSRCVPRRDVALPAVRRPRRDAAFLVALLPMTPFSRPRSPRTRRPTRSRSDRRGVGALRASGRSARASRSRSTRGGGAQPREAGYAALAMALAVRLRAGR
jgi:hypothetical protein